MSHTFRDILQKKLSMWWEALDVHQFWHVPTREQLIEYEKIHPRKVYGDGLPRWWHKEHVRRSRHHTKQALHTRQLNRIEPYSKDNWWD